MQAAWIIEQARDQPDRLQVAGELRGFRANEAREAELREVIGDYQRALESRSSQPLNDRLVPLGRRLWRWLAEGGENLIEGLVDRGRPRRLEFHLHSTIGLEAGDSAARLADLIANAPWELLADDRGPLALRSGSEFVVRRHFPGDPREWPRSEYRLGVYFMAASPRGQTELDYEGEEVAIEEASGRLGLDLMVEETGELSQLADLLAEDAPDSAQACVVHLTAHGGHEDSGPVVYLEDETGAADPVSPRLIWDQTGDREGIRLYFISACHTGSSSDQSASFAGQLSSFGAPACLSWGGAVGDRAAIEFASKLYSELNAGRDLFAAYRRARERLIEQAESRDWMLPRLFIAGVDAPKFETGRVSRRAERAKQFGENALLAENRRIQIAPFHQFVGRREELKANIRAFRDDDAVVLHGPGQRGKSSLAGRIARRFPKHRHVAVYGDEFCLGGLLTRLKNAYSSAEFTRHCRDVEAQASNAPEFLRELLIPLLRQAAEITPLLLILDDFEQCLDDPRAGELHRVRASLAPLLAALLEAFDEIEGSHLLITSRYLFEPVGDVRPVAIEPPEFTVNDHWRQALRLWSESDSGGFPNGKEFELYQKAMNLASGSPGLMNRLFSIIRTDADAAGGVLVELERSLQSSDAPTESRLAEYLAYMAVDAMLDALSDGERRLLRWSLDWKFPAPRDVVVEIFRRSIT